MSEKNYDFKQGFKDGIPIALAYLPISMAIAVDAVLAGLNFSMAQVFGIIYTGSGQGIFLNYFKKGETLVLMYIFMLFIANFRYAIFAISMSQKMKSDTPVWQKLLFGIINTDEVYVLAMQNHGTLSGKYLMGLAFSPFLGYLIGNTTGSLVTGLIPDIVKPVLGIMLYGLFIAMVVPSAKKSKKVLWSVIITIIFSYILEAIPAVGETISSWGIKPAGITMITCAVSAAAICAWLAPIEEDELAEPKEEKINE